MTAAPIIRQISWPGMLPQLVTLAAAMGLGVYLGGRPWAIWAALAWMGYSFGSRMIFARSHAAGMQFVKQQRWSEAVSEFKDSFDYFEKHPWIDRYRSIVLMSASAASYREMALANIAYCHLQMGNRKQSRAYYERCLERFPSSRLAAAGLKLLDSSEPAESH